MLSTILYLLVLTIFLLFVLFGVYWLVRFAVRKELKNQKKETEGTAIRES